MDPCDRYPCSGAIDEMGFCDHCDRLPQAAPSTRERQHQEPVDAAVPARRVGSRRVADLLTIPVLEFPDPTSRLVDIEKLPEIPEAARWCPVCGSPVSREYAGQAAVVEGYCPTDQTPFSYAPPSLRAGDLVDDRYQVVGLIARGGFGYVYLARDRHLEDQFVALKRLPNTPSRVALALQTVELQRLIAIDHPHIVRASNYVKHRDPGGKGSTAYIVMEFLDGVPLSQLRRSDQELTFEDLLAYGLEILAAMDYLHSRGLLYCDMKPDNVIRCGDRIKVIDLGGVRQIGDRDSPILGTPGYQVARAEINEAGLTVRSDIHTVGVTLRELYRAVSTERTVGGYEAFGRLVDRAAHPDRGRRFGSAAQMAEQLRGVAREFLAVRDHTEHPVRSSMFAVTAQLLDDGLGAVPPLEHWITGVDAGQLGFGLPSPSLVAVRLPAPQVAADDPAARLLDSAPSAASVIEKASLQPDSVELTFAACRAFLERSDADSAERQLQAARRLLGSRAEHDWRVAWHAGLCELAKGRVGSASTSFEQVYQALPGEVAPKLALAACAELLLDQQRSIPGGVGSDQEVLAKTYYQVVWWRDRSMASAAFGLARLCLARNHREEAVKILDEVPRISRHYDAAQIAAFRVLAGRMPDGLPSEQNLAEAIRRLSELQLDGGERRGQARERLEASVRQVALDRVLQTGRPALSGGDPLLGTPANERNLRVLLEDSFRVLALRARSASEHGILVDRANKVRPKTLR